MHFTNQSERELAAALIDEVLLVGRDTLMRGLRSLIGALLLDRNDTARPIALFAERAVPKLNGEVLPLYPGSRMGRATGPGILPIVVDPADQEIGSEALVGNLITDLQRHYYGDVLSHPGPDQMRAARVRHIVIVTDFIGSGKRVWEMLEAFRTVATFRSWRSYGLIDFRVLAYSGTEEGLKRVLSSRLRPKIATVAGCPTLHNTFNGAQLSDVPCALSPVSVSAQTSSGLLGFRCADRLRTWHAQQRAPYPTQPQERVDTTLSWAQHGGSGNGLPLKRS